MHFFADLTPLHPPIPDTVTIVGLGTWGLFERLCFCALGFVGGVFVCGLCCGKWDLGG